MSDFCLFAVLPYLVMVLALCPCDAEGCVPTISCRSFGQLVCFFVAFNSYVRLDFDDLNLIPFLKLDEFVDSGLGLLGVCSTVRDAGQCCCRVRVYSDALC